MKELLLHICNIVPSRDHEIDRIENGTPSLLSFTTMFSLNAALPVLVTVKLYWIVSPAAAKVVAAGTESLAIDSAGLAAIGKIAESVGEVTGLPPKLPLAEATLVVLPSAISFVVMV